MKNEKMLINSVEENIELLKGELLNNEKFKKINILFINYYNKPLDLDDDIMCCPTAVRPKMNNSRIRAQKALLIIPSIIEYENIFYITLMKEIIIPYGSKEKIREHLKLCYIDSLSLFSDLGGFKYLFNNTMNIKIIFNKYNFNIRECWVNFEGR